MSQVVDFNSINDSAMDYHALVTTLQSSRELAKCFNTFDAQPTEALFCIRTSGCVYNLHPSQLKSSNDLTVFIPQNRSPAGILTIHSRKY